MVVVVIVKIGMRAALITRSSSLTIVLVAALTLVYDTACRSRRERPDVFVEALVMSGSMFEGICHVATANSPEPDATSTSTEEPSENVDLATAVPELGCTVTSVYVMLIFSLLTVYCVMVTFSWMRDAERATSERSFSAAFVTSAASDTVIVGFVFGEGSEPASVPATDTNAAVSSTASVLLLSCSNACATLVTNSADFIGVEGVSLGLVLMARGSVIHAVASSTMPHANEPPMTADEDDVVAADPPTERIAASWSSRSSLALTSACGIEGPQPAACRYDSTTDAVARANRASRLMLRRCGLLW
eukprot:PhM_4_TR13677/c7_g1_i1/m.19377